LRSVYLSGKQKVATKRKMQKDKEEKKEEDEGGKKNLAIRKH
jgi:hypothetical protein